MGLRLEDAVRSEKRSYTHGTKTYVFLCSACGREISSQTGGFATHSGKCRSCSQKKKPFIAAYHQMTANKHTRKVDVTMTYDEFLEFCHIPDCHYCGDVIARSAVKGEKGYRGYFLDRKDNNGPYSKENCVTCCWKCNQTKGNRYTYAEFLRVADAVKAFSNGQQEEPDNLYHCALDRFDECWSPMLNW